MLRGERRARAEGALIFVLVDVALGRERRARPAALPFFGRVISRPSRRCVTFAARAGLQPHLVVADYDEADGMTRVRSHCRANAGRMLRNGSSITLRASPGLWERLIDLHKFSRSGSDHAAFCRSRWANDY